ncbi:Gfo/Idh/MocA family oxidoreductase [bacterium]|nr:Gfo/Idh/MocA family oxidoreductase [bacterium]
MTNMPLKKKKQSVKANIKLKKIKLGLIGAGGRGLHLLDTINKYFSDEAHFIALCDVDIKRLKKMSRESKENFCLFSDYKKMLGLKDLDAVIIATPDFTHGEIALEALSAGKHVLCEKPLAITAGDCSKIIEASKKSEKIFQVGFNLRYNPFHQKLKELVDNKSIGNIKIISVLDYYSGGKTYFRRWNRFRKNTGGLLIHKGCHVFDMLNWLIGASPERVSAFGGLDVFRPDPKKAKRCRDCKEKYTCHGSAFYQDFLRPGSINRAERRGYKDFDVCLWNSEKDTQDNDVVIIEYKNAVRVSYTECFFSSISTRRYSIVGDKAQIEADTESNQIKVFSMSSKSTIIYDVKNPGSDEHGGGDRGILHSFLACLRENKSPLANAEAGRLSVLVGLAAEKSIHSKKIINIKDMEK